MAELPEWSAQALRYPCSDGPVKVMYFRSRLEVTYDSFDQNSAGPKERPELGEQISFKASEASDTRAVFSGRLFDDLVEDPVQVLDSKDYKLHEEAYFEDRKSALGDLASKFDNFPRVLPFDIESSYGPKDLYIEPRLIKRSKEDEYLWYWFKAHPTDTKDFEAIKVFPLYIPWKGSEERSEDKGKGKENKRKKGGREGKKKEEKEEKKEVEENKNNKIREEEKDRERILKTFREVEGMIPRRGLPYRCQCALIFGITTKFNPSGIWIVEDIFYDEGERE